MLLDGYKRKIDYLRISVTDQCNLRCMYCMPEEYCYSHHSFLTFDEIIKVCEAAVSLGIRKIKITGGEPLMRKNLPDLIDRIHNIKGIESITITTNGVLLKEQCKDLREAGLSGINISFDTRIPERYKKITKQDCYDKAFDGLLTAISFGIPTKINSVLIEGMNQDEIESLASFAKEYPIDVRFIELMPMGCEQTYQGIPNDEIKRILEKRYGNLLPNTLVHGNGPAVYYDIKGFHGSIGFISALTHQFCKECNRIRLTCDGMLKLCLQYEEDIDLKPILKSKSTKEELKKRIQEAIIHKPVSHQFGKAGDQKEKKLMSQIGG